MAVAGKGGVGKTTVAALLSLALAGMGRRVIAVDADPAGNLALSLGVPAEVRSKIKPILDMEDLVEERTGAKPGGGYTLVFSLSPKVDDLVEKFGVECPGGVTLLLLGTIRHAGSGCFCPAHALLKALVSHLVLERGEDVVMDMEAGVEHLGRAVVKRADAVLVVTEPTVRSVEVAANIVRMARSLGVRNVLIVANKVRGERDTDAVRSMLAEHELELAASLPYEVRLARLELVGAGLHELPLRSGLVKAARSLAEALVGFE